MTNEQTPDKNIVDPQQAEKNRLNTLDTLRTGASYTINPAMSLYPTEEIGQPSVVADGDKLRVAAEFAVPREVGSDGRISRFDFFAVISSENKGAYAIAGLEPDENGTMRMTTFDPSNWLYPGGPTQLIIGRDIANGVHNPNKIWGSGKGYGPATSRKHIEFTLNPDGSLTAATLGANGSWGEFGHERESSEREPAALRQSQEVQLSKDLRFKPIEADPKYMELSRPYRDALNAIDEKYKEARARLEIAYQHDQQGGRSREHDILDQRQQLFQKIATEQAPIRKQFEAVLKPYLDERLQLFDGDKAAGFMHEGQLVDGGREVKSAGGKQVSRAFNTTRNGNLMFADANPYPLYGQLLMDGRDNSWGASRTAQKTDDERGGQTTSAQRVVDIAAAMLAGTFTGSRQPIQYRKAEMSDFTNRSLTSDSIYRLQQEVNFYVITLGAHRVMAARLIRGLDAPLTGATNTANLQ